MGYKVDYHIHSYFSDGTMKPTDIVKKYKNDEYDIISLTDHDGIDGVNEAVIAGEALKIKVVPGIELSTDYDFDGEKVELHILGYNIDIENRRLNEKLISIRKDRHERNEKLFKLLNDLGYELTWEDIKERPSQTYIGKPNFARAMDRKGYKADNKWEIFDKVKKSKISTYGSIDLIKGAGGIAVLAHPLKIKKIGEAKSEDFYKNLDVILKDLKKLGLGGIECFHPSADEENAHRLVGLAEKYHLHITQGSDFHTEKMKNK